jgi:addiction module HigA family antidote
MINGGFVLNGAMGTHGLWKWLTITEELSMSIRIEDLSKMDFSDVATGERLPAVTPGEMLLEEFLKPLALTQYRLAKDIGVSQRRIGEIVAGKRAITADTDLRLCQYFGLSDGWWLRLQAHYDTEQARDAMTEILARIPRCDQLAA